MKKHYSFLLAALAASLAAGAVNVPYSSNIGDRATSAIASDWTIKDNNLDKTTWTYDSANDKLTAVTGADCGVKYGYNNNNAADDWAISPGFELTAGTEYIISFWAKDPKASETNKGNEAMNVYVGQTHFVEDFETMTPVKAFNKNFGAGWNNHKISFTPEADGTYHVAFQACSEKGQWGIYLRGFKIKSNALTPAAPTDLSVVPAADKSLSAKLQWTLPTTDDEGNALTTALDAVTVRRNGEVVATLGGDATEYTDSEIPEAGIYEYSVTVSLGGVESLPAKVTSAWIGQKTPQVLPYSEMFKDPDFFKTFWTTIDVAGDAKTNTNTTYPPLSNAWCFQSNMMGNAWWAALYSSRNADITDDDWLISAPLAFPAAGKYKVSFRLAMYTGAQYGCRIGVYAGKNDTPDAFDIEIASVESVASTQLNPNTDGTLFEYEFEAPSAGVYYIGFHSTNPASTMERRLQLGAFNIEVVELYEDAAIVPPYDSAEDADWADASKLTFALARGYYHATWATEGTAALEAAAASADTEWADEYAVVKVTEDGNATFSADAPFTAFAIAPVDHTPAAAAKCKYVINDNGTITFSYTASELNVEGSKLYEILGVRVYADGELMAESEGCAPGEKASLVYGATNAIADEPAQAAPEYTVTLHNLSGESEAAVAEHSSSGIEDVAADKADGAVRMFTTGGIEVDASSALPAGIYIELRGSKACKKIVK